MEIIIQGAGPANLFPTPLDFDSFDSVEEVLAEIYKMSANYGVMLYPAKTTEEELNDIYTACQDLDKPVTTIENLWVAHELIQEHGDAFMKFIGLGLTADEPCNWGELFTDSFQSEWDSKAEFAEDYYSQVNSETYEVIQASDLPVDWDAYADSLESNEGFHFEDAGSWGRVYVFSDVN